MGLSQSAASLLGLVLTQPLVLYNDEERTLLHCAHSSLTHAEPLIPESYKVVAEALVSGLEQTRCDCQTEDALLSLAKVLRTSACAA